MARALRNRNRVRPRFGAALLLWCAGALADDAALGIHAADSALPETLAGTGLFAAGATAIRAGVYSFTPQYPLWSDGASKQRWLYLPPGTSIDGADADAWAFPPGTRTWKEFSHGRRVETRFIERLADGSWRYATYVWDADGREARLAPERGTSLSLAGDAGKTAGARYAVPSRDDCRACHEGAAVPVLGFSALQLAADRDASAPHAEAKRPGDVDLPALLDRGLVRNAAAGEAPSLRASSPVARTALGYLHANCGHCHNARGPLADLGLVLAQGFADPDSEGRVSRSTVGRDADARVLGLDTRIEAGQPDESQLLARMKSANVYNRMPPLGTTVIDDRAVALVEQWIQQMQNGEGNSQ